MKYNKKHDITSKYSLKFELEELCVLITCEVFQMFLDLTIYGYVLYNLSFW